MSYKYCVVWFEKAKSGFKGTPWPLLPRVKVFRSLDQTKKFQKEFAKPYPKIYRLMEATP